MIQQFYKDKEGWFIDLPEFIEEGHGTKGNLAMVSGADTMLDKLSNNKKRITLRIETEDFEGADGKLRKVGICFYGENYMFTSAEHTHRVWLCPVTKYVFGGKYPNKIYIQKVA
jgi:hypothetical protein